MVKVGVGRLIDLGGEKKESKWIFFKKLLNEYLT